MIVLIASVTVLVTSLVSFLVFVFLEVPLPRAFMRLVSLGFAQTLLVPLVFRIILVVSLVLE